MAAKQWRSAEILTALQRLGYLDKPGVGDHVRLFKKVAKHPGGPLTMQSGLDMGQNPCSKKDVGRIRRETKLDDDAMWERAMTKKLTLAEYDQHLRETPLEDLVLPFWRTKIVERGKKSDDDQQI